LYILGISAYYHDSAATLINDEQIIAAAQEERFTRKKHDSGFPKNAVTYCLKEAAICLNDIDYIAFYDKPFLKFERLLETYIAEAPRGIKSFVMAMPIWLKEKLFLKSVLIKELNSIDGAGKKELEKKLFFNEHHLSHAASAFYPSPFHEAAILTIDGVGEWTSTSLAHGKGNDINILKEIKFPHSLGLLYSAFTYYTGFKVNSAEYKVMGLAPYGEPKYVKLIKDNLIDIKDDGSFKLNMEYFNYTTGLTMTGNKFHELFDGAPKGREEQVTEKEMDLARSIQEVTEEVVLKLSRFVKNETGCKNLCMAGGVALNCVSNGKLLREKIFDGIWVQPAAGDAGGALGSAYSAYYKELGNARTVNTNDNMQGSYLGPKFSNDEVKGYLDSINAVYHKVNGEDELYDKISDALNDEKVIGWAQGRMEFGPRALGARSIIGDARSKAMQSKMNLKIKYRESFRPFAPSVLRESVGEYFDIDTESPYMLLVADVREDLRIPMTEEQKRLFGIDKLNIPRSTIPAITHVDYSARVQTVNRDTNPRYHNLISRFKEKTGYSVIVNTSFNVRGEPIVCTPEDSYRCFMRTEMDVLTIEDYILYKEEQPDYEDKSNWKEEFELD
jgi:carbamoyltransferase